MANAVISGGGVEMQLKYGANMMLVTVYSYRYTMYTFEIIKLYHLRVRSVHYTSIQCVQKLKGVHNYALTSKRFDQHHISILALCFIKQGRHDVKQL